MTVRQVAKALRVDPSTVRTWLRRGDCPSVRKGRRGPGGSAILNLQDVIAWRGKGQGGLATDEVMRRIAEALLESVERDHVDVRVDITKEAAIAAMLIVWDRCCKTFGESFKWDAQPESIRALARQL